METGTNPSTWLYFAEEARNSQYFSSRTIFALGLTIRSTLETKPLEWPRDMKVLVATISDDSKKKLGSGMKSTVDESEKKELLAEMSR